MAIRRLTEKMHISWLVAAWCLGLTVGVIAVHYLPRSVEFNVLALFGGLMLFVPALVWRRRALLIMAIISGGLVGLWRGEMGRAGFGGV